MENVTYALWVRWSWDLGAGFACWHVFGRNVDLRGSLGNLGVECTCFFVGLFYALLALYYITITLYSEHKTWSAFPLLERGGWLPIRMASIAREPCLAIQADVQPINSTLFEEGKRCPFFSLEFRECSVAILLFISLDLCWVCNYFLNWNFFRNVS